MQQNSVVLIQKRYTLICKKMLLSDIFESVSQFLVAKIKLKIRVSQLDTNMISGQDEVDRIFVEQCVIFLQ